MEIVKQSEFCGKKKAGMELSSISTKTIFRGSIGSCHISHVWLKCSFGDGPWSTMNNLMLL